MGLGLDNPVHILILLLVLLLLFGARRLPEMGRSLGEGMRGFKDALMGHGDQPQTLTSASSTPQPAPPAAVPSQAPTPTPDA